MNEVALGGVNWVGFGTLVRREITRFFSVYKQTVIPSLVTSALYIIIFGFTLERRMASINGIAYSIYILPGLVMMNAITNAYNNTASSLLQIKLLQQIQDFLVTPLSATELSSAFILGGTVRGVVNGLLVILLGMAMTGMPVEHPLLALCFLVLISWAFSSAGLILGILAETWDDIATMINFFLTPLLFLGGVFYSLQMLPPLWRTLSHANPLYYMVDGFRYAVLGVSDSNPVVAVAVALGMTVAFTVGGILLFRSGYRIRQ